MSTPTADNVSGTFYGVHVIDDESGAIAATHDRHKALAAIDAYHQHAGGEGPTDWGVDTDDLVQGWGWFEEKPDGPWHYCSVDRPDRPDVFPATWLSL